jgi:hypothetical protein
VGGVVGRITSNGDRWTIQQLLAAFVMIIMLIVAFLLFIIGRPDYSERQHQRIGTTEGSRKANIQEGTDASNSSSTNLDASQEAIQIVRRYPIPGKGQTVDDALRLAYPKAYSLREMLAWTSDPVRGMEDQFEVKFSIGGEEKYIFLVQPKTQDVQGGNVPTIALLYGSPTKARKPAAKRRKRPSLTVDSEPPLNHEEVIPPSASPQSPQVEGPASAAASSTPAKATAKEPPAQAPDESELQDVPDSKRHLSSIPDNFSGGPNLAPEGRN